MARNLHLVIAFGFSNKPHRKPGSAYLNGELVRDYRNSIYKIT
jgi:hypothetical protein